MTVLLIIAAVLMVAVACLSYRKRHLSVAKTMILLMLGASCYAIGNALEIMSQSLSETKWALQVQYLGIPFVSTLWLLQIIQFTGTAAKYRKRLVLLLFLIPASVFIGQLTNEWHHLLYESYIQNENGSIPIYTTVKGPWYKLHTVYSYLVMITGIVLCVRMYLRALPMIRKQILILLMGAVTPMLFNLFFWFGVTVDLTPFGFAVSGIVYMWGIFRFNLLRLTPLALAKVFETIRDGIILLDYENQIVSYNRAAAEVLPELALNKRYPAPALVVLADSPALQDRIERTDTGDERFPFQKIHAEGIKHYLCSVSYVYDAGTVPVGKMLMFNDITELKENEERLRENARQLSELNAFKDKLFTVMAHEIRDPIALLVSLTELLGAELTAADVENAELMRELKGQVQSTFHLVDNLLDWYRSQKGRVAFHPVGWNLQQVVRQAVSLAGTKAGMKQIRLIEQIGEQLTVNADKEMLDLILRNLLSNAIKYTGIGGIIEVGAAQEGNSVIVRVCDNGVGMDEQTAEMLRREEPFFKVHAAGEDARDTRFGLVLTREFVRIHGGNLWFESVPGKGTTFYFTLPTAAGSHTLAGREASMTINV